MRARFAAECLRDAAPALDRHAALTASVRVSSKKVARAMKLTGPARRKAVCAVESLMANDPDAQDRIRASVADDGTVDAPIVALARLAQEVAHVRAHVPAGLLADAGLTADVLDTLDSASRKARCEGAFTAARHSVASPTRRSRAPRTRGSDRARGRTSPCTTRRPPDRSAAPRSYSVS